VEKAIELLLGAKRPVTIAGEGAWQSGASKQLQAFAEATGIPVFTHYQSHGILPSDHKLYGGSFFKMADLNEPDNRPDVILALGVGFGVYTLDVIDKVVPADAKFIHVEVDVVEIGRLRQVNIPIVADSKEVLRALNTSLTSKNVASRDLGAWHKTIHDIKARRSDRLASMVAHRSESVLIHPLQAATAIVDSTAEDAILIGDGAEAHQWLAEAVRPQHPDCYFTHGHFVCLRFGLAFAVGAQSAFPERQALLVTGDGGVGFTIAEFDTTARHGLPIVVVIMNNRVWGATRHFQELFSRSIRGYRACKHTL
jgi:acetolactate synthase-1/2/3 large subunit